MALDKKVWYLLSGSGCLVTLFILNTTLILNDYDTASSMMYFVISFVSVSTVMKILNVDREDKLTWGKLIWFCFNYKKVIALTEANQKRAKANAARRERKEIEHLEAIAREAEERKASMNTIPASEPEQKTPARGSLSLVK